MKERIHSFDFLRAILLLLLFVIHAALPFIEIDMLNSWPYPSKKTHFIFDGLIGFIHLFRVPLFFILAGYLSSQMLAKYKMKTTLYIVFIVLFE